MREPEESPTASLPSTDVTRTVTVATVADAGAIRPGTVHVSPDPRRRYRQSGP